MNKENLPAVIEQSARAQGLSLQNVNLIMPTETFGAVLGEFDKITIETVKVNTQDPREVYEPSGKGKGFALGKPALQAIAQALSIQFHPQLTGIVESTARRSRAKAVGIMRKPNGEVITQTEEKTIDLDVEEDDLREKAEKDSDGGRIVGWEKSSSGKSFPKKEPFKNDSEREQWIELQVKSGIKQKRKFKDELAMTGAKDRVIRAFLALKATYTEEELARPLAFPRVIMDTSKMLNDPRTRQAAIGLIGQATADLYGKVPAPIPAPQEETILEQTIDASDALETRESEAKNVTPDISFELEQDGFDSADHDKRSAAIRSLDEYLASNVLNDSQKNRIQAVCDDPNTPIEGEGGLLYYLDLCKKQEEIRLRGKGGAR